MGIEFIAPEFVEGNEADEIQQRMMESLPADIDDMPGGFPYDFTMPTALEKAELIQLHLVRTLMLMFPMWAWGEWLDYHGAAAGIKRREAGFASGEVSIKGLEGTKIAKGIIFATAATDVSSSIEFMTTEENEIGEEGCVVVPVRAVLPGSGSNVNAKTVVLLLKPVNGITQVINEADITGGSEEEGDDSLRERIQTANESIGASYVGNDSDYIRWAKEVVGVGAVAVIPEWNGPGSVKLILLDTNGQPANESIVSAVYNHIIHPEERILRKAPIGATLTVASPRIVKIAYAGQVVLKDGYEIEYVEKAFRKELVEYYEAAQREGILKYTRLAAILSSVDGIFDYEDFLVNGEKKNILITGEEYPETDTIDFKWEVPV